jgi:hypothetical protein
VPIYVSTSFASFDGKMKHDPGSMWTPEQIETWYRSVREVEGVRGVFLRSYHRFTYDPATITSGPAGGLDQAWQHGQRLGMPPSRWLATAVHHRGSCRRSRPLRPSSPMITNDRVAPTVATA